MPLEGAGLGGKQMSHKTGGLDTGGCGGGGEEEVLGGEGG